MYLDLDNLKQVNDRLGHGAGDAMLMEFGQRLSQCVRPSDLVARMGGDEFAIVLDDLSKPNDAELAVDHIRQALAAPFAYGRESIFLSASIGIATCTAATPNAHVLLSNADRAMYAAKHAGKGTFQVHVDESEL